VDIEFNLQNGFLDKRTGCRGFTGKDLAVV
jgi:hypothetical protein